MKPSACCTPRRETPCDSPDRPPHAPAAERKFGGQLITLPGGRFLMGTDDPEQWAEDAEGPVREVEIRPFALDATAVTNRQFAEFVEATGYRSDAEKFGWSYVFIRQLPKAWRKPNHSLGHAAQCEWWIGVKGANWRSPEGPGSAVCERMEHPVVHVSWHDAAAFSRWAGKRLPTEAEWEFAARGGLVQKRYPWGDELTPDGRHMCNIWQGKFPEINRPDDGYLWTAPVKSYPPNGLGFYEMSGNVWEWCADRWETAWGTTPGVNPHGSETGDARVIRGGSYLCHKSYCNRYRVAARSKNTPDSTTSHTGFRCAADG